MELSGVTATEGKRLVAVAAGAVLCWACNKETTHVFTDTEGRSYSAICKQDGNCKFTRRQATPTSPDKEQLALHTPGTVVTFCDVASPGGQPAEAADCRALVCRDDADCPPAHGLAHGACVNGLCREPAQEVSRHDAIVLCLAGTGLGRTAENQVERYALGLNCGNPCQVPKTCRGL